MGRFGIVTRGAGADTAISATPDGGGLAKLELLPALGRLVRAALAAAVTLSARVRSTDSASSLGLRPLLRTLVDLLDVTVCHASQVAGARLTRILHRHCRAHLVRCGRNLTGRDRRLLVLALLLIVLRNNVEIWL